MCDSLLSFSVDESMSGLQFSSLQFAVGGLHPAGIGLATAPNSLGLTRDLRQARFVALLSRFAAGKSRSITTDQAPCRPQTANCEPLTANR